MPNYAGFNKVVLELLVVSFLVGCAYKTYKYPINVPIYGGVPGVVQFAKEQHYQDSCWVEDIRDGKIIVKCK